MAKKDVVDKDINYKIERINVPMNRDELDKLCDELKSDDDFINYCLEEAEQVHARYMITIMNDETKSPVKNSTGDRSYGFMRPADATEFLNEYIDEGKANSKPKEVMRSGYNKKSNDKYMELVNQESEETVIVNQYTKPSFEDVMSNTLVNVYNGETYNEKDDELPDDLRDNVGVIIPGLIETTEEYFEFVRRLKDKGKGGLGRSIYERYEDYLDAVDIINRYKEALYDKYGSKEEFFAARELGGIFGAYEYYPMIKPRFKKNHRNMKLDRGINLNELASIKDMGARIRKELEEEINAIDVSDYDVVEYEDTPGKFRDLPEDLALLYKNDIEGKNGFDEFNKFKSIYQYAKELIANKDNEKDIDEGYKILDMLERERIAQLPTYDSEFVDILEGSVDDLRVVLNQYGYDKLVDYCGVENADNIHDVSHSYIAFKKFVKDQICIAGNIDPEDMFLKAQVEDAAEYATKYMFNKGFREAENAKSEMNAAGDVLYKNNRRIELGESSERDRESGRAGESKVQSFIREIASSASNALDNLNSNADTSGYNNTSSIRDVVGYKENSLDVGMVGFELLPTPESVMKYMADNELFAKKVYEIGADGTDDEMFSMRTSSREFANKSIESTKPFVTNDVINKMLKSNKRRRGVE